MPVGLALPYIPFFRAAPSLPKPIPLSLDLPALEPISKLNLDTIGSGKISKKLLVNKERLIYFFQRE